LRLAVSDTGPINDLVLIGHIQVLGELFSMLIIPHAVRDELAAPGAPESVRNWIANPPSWVDIHQSQSRVPLAITSGLDLGEASAIAIAAECKADLLLMDDRAGVAAARHLGFAVTGTLGILVLAARQGRIDLAAAFERLQATNFRCRKELMDQLLGDLA
jgi:predicted nucleic acid-binding protein